MYDLAAPTVLNEMYLLGEFGTETSSIVRRSSGSTVSSSFYTSALSAGGVTCRLGVTQVAQMVMRVHRPVRFRPTQARGLSGLTLLLFEDRKAVIESDPLEHAAYLIEDGKQAGYVLDFVHRLTRLADVDASSRSF
jgi:hypothetical protein